MSPVMPHELELLRRVLGLDYANVPQTKTLILDGDDPDVYDLQRLVDRGLLTRTKTWGATIYADGARVAKKPPGWMFTITEKGEQIALESVSNA